MRRLATPGRLAAVGLILLAAVAAVLVLAPGGDTYIFLPDDSAHAVGPLVTVEGEKPDGDAGGIYYVNVVVRKATLLERIWPGVHEGADLVPAHALNPTGLSEAERRRGNLREMSRSHQIAAAVALRELGYDVEAKPIGVLVAAVDPSAPAAGKLQPTDLVVSVDGQRVRMVDELFELMREKNPGEEVRFGVRRGDELKQIRLETIAHPTEEDRAIVGFSAEQGAEIELPLDVSIETGDVGGPSAGLAFALDIVDELGRDVDRERKIAVTGEIELDGDVAPVGGVEQKTIGARRSGVDVFVVPAGDNAETARKHAGDMRVIPVRSFQQALRALSTAS